MYALSVSGTFPCFFLFLPEMSADCRLFAVLCRSCSLVSRLGVLVQDTSRATWPLMMSLSVNFLINNYGNVTVKKRRECNRKPNCTIAGIFRTGACKQVVPPKFGKTRMHARQTQHTSRTHTPTPHSQLPALVLLPALPHLLPTPPDCHGSQVFDWRQLEVQRHHRICGGIGEQQAIIHRLYVPVLLIRALLLSIDTL